MFAPRSPAALVLPRSLPCAGHCCARPQCLQLRPLRPVLYDRESKVTTGKLVLALAWPNLVMQLRSEARAASSSQAKVPMPMFLCLLPSTLAAVHGDADLRHPRLGLPPLVVDRLTFGDAPEPRRLLRPLRRRMLPHQRRRPVYPQRLHLRPLLHLIREVPSRVSHVCSGAPNPSPGKPGSGMHAGVGNNRTLSLKGKIERKVENV